MSRARLPIAREGWPFIAPALVLGLLTAGRYPLLSVGALALAATLAAFFRDPERHTPVAPSRLYAPADGRVLLVEPIDGAPLIDAPAWRVGVFLSLLDVHINRSPAAGTVRLCEHTSGVFRGAWKPGVELVNERTMTLIETPRGSIVVVQIAGLVGRRTVTHRSEGDSLAQGERLGLIKFGSRTDLIFPRALARPLVRPGERVWGGLTPLAVWL